MCAKGGLKKGGEKFWIYVDLIKIIRLTVEGRRLTALLTKITDSL